MRKNNRDLREIRTIEAKKNSTRNLKLASGYTMSAVEFAKDTIKPKLDLSKPIKYYVATLKGGHVRQNRYITFSYYIRANNKKQAYEACNQAPRAKKHSYGFVISLKEISYEEYLYGLKMSRQDPYLLCCNPQDQKLIYGEIEDRILEEPEAIRNRAEYIDHIDQMLSSGILIVP